MSVQNRLLHRLSHRSPGGLDLSHLTSVDIDTLWPALAGLGALWVSARHGVRQKAPLVLHVGQGRDAGDGAISGLARAPNGGVARQYAGARPVLVHGAAANSCLEIDFDIPQSYMIYAVWSVPATGSAGIVGNGSPVGWRFYSSATALGLRHSSGTNLVASNNVRTDGLPNVGWACFNSANSQIYSAGMNGSVARVAHFSTQVWASDPSPPGRSVRVGSADGVAAAQSIYDAIVVPSPLYITQPTVHQTIVAALAANVGLTAA